MRAGHAIGHHFCCRIEVQGPDRGADYPDRGARHISAAQLDGLVFDYPVIRQGLRVLGLGVMWGTQHSWHQVNRGDFRVSRVLPLLDEGPCTICSLEDIDEVAASPACEWTQVQIPGMPIDVQLSSDAPYFPPAKARAWLAEYNRRCVRGVADCGDGLQFFYDLMACQEF